ncbi:MAG: hypothetical protein D6730_06045 [Bacteroidetes bacterium]|nr:MAG: hypothetical protein D6730_06045 [Bacteroidota bacterium]
MLLVTDLPAQYYGVQPQSETWSLGLKVGNAMIKGEVQPEFPSYQVGLYGQKSLGRAVDVRLQVQGGFIYGLNGTPSAGFMNNPAWNGTNNPLAAYDSLDMVYDNFRMEFYDLSFLFKLNLNRLGAYGGEGWDLYALAGVGAMLYQTKVDAYNAATADRYRFEGIAANDPRQTRQKLRELLDGEYETLAEQDYYNSSHLGKYTVNTLFTLGGGIKFMLGTHLALGLEGRYNFIGDDLLDGQQWQDSQNITPEADRLLSASLLLEYVF